MKTIMTDIDTRQHYLKLYEVSRQKRIIKQEIAIKMFEVMINFEYRQTQLETYRKERTRRADVGLEI